MEFSVLIPNDLLCDRCSKLLFSVKSMIIRVLSLQIVFSSVHLYSSIIYLTFVIVVMILAQIKLFNTFLYQILCSCISVCFEVISVIKITAFLSVFQLYFSVTSGQNLFLSSVGYAYTVQDLPGHMTDIPLHSRVFSSEPLHSSSLYGSSERYPYR